MKNGVVNDDLFMRLTTVHRPDCVLFDDRPLPQSIPTSEELELTETDEAVEYAKQCRLIYEDLRRVIGQLAGLMVLAQLSQSSSIADLKDLENCQKRFEQASDQITMLIAPPSLKLHRAQVEAACFFSGMTLKKFSELHLSGDNKLIFDQMAGFIRRAYAHLAYASLEKAGMQMVDFSHACCSCAMSNTKKVSINTI